MVYQVPKDIDFVAYYQRVGVQESQDLHWASHWRDKLIERVEYGHVQNGAELPWRKTHDWFRLRPKELTIWAGEDGHRKSLVVGQIMLHLARKQRVCVISLEMPPEDTLERMVRQAAGCQPSVEYIDQFSSWSHERICLYDQLDTVPSEKVLGVTYYAVNELGCEHVVVDSLMKCGYDIDDYPAQVRFVDQLSRTAKALNVHIHLVHHMGKSENPNDNSKRRIFGSSQMLNHAHNVVTIWFNENRQEAMQAQEAGYVLSKAQVEQINEKRDQVLTIRKQRNGIPFRAFGFYFDERSLQLVESEGQRISMNLARDIQPVPDNVQPLQDLYEPGATG